MYDLTVRVKYQPDTDKPILIEYTRLDSQSVEGEEAKFTSIKKLPLEEPPEGVNRIRAKHKGDPRIFSWDRDKSLTDRWTRTGFHGNFKWDELANDRETPIIEWAPITETEGEWVSE